MTTCEASLDYWADGSTPPARAYVQNDPESSRTETLSIEDESFDDDVFDNERHAGRNRFSKFLVLGALILPIIVFVGYQISASHSPEVSETVFKSSGVKALTADELVATVSSQGRPVFWLNHLSGDLYSDNTTTSGVDVISYLPDNANPQFINQLDLVIKTYRNLNVYDVQTHSLAGENGAVVENLGRVTVTYNPSSPDHSLVTFKDRPQIVSINYPSFQSVPTLVMDAQNLMPIK